MGDELTRKAAYDRVIKEELQSMVAVLTTGERTVYAIVIAIEPPTKSVEGDIEYRGHAYRWHSEDLTRTPTNVILEALEREVARIKEALK